MPSGGTIKWNIREFEALRRSPGVQRLISAEVDKVLSRVGGLPGDYRGGTGSGKTRTRGYVVTNSANAMRREASGEHALLRAMVGG